MKRCNRCGKHKLASDFHRAAGKSDGLSSHCKACRKAYLQRPEVKKVRSEYMRTDRIRKMSRECNKTRRSDPVKGNRIREQQRTYYAKNRSDPVKLNALREYFARYWRERRRREKAAKLALGILAMQAGNLK
jgi:hypothetical protein